MFTVAVRLTPWAKQRIIKAYCKTERVTKSAIRASLREFPDTEFHTVGDLNTRSGAVLTVKEAHAAGIDLLEVRADNLSLIAAVYINQDGSISIQ